MRSLIRNLMVLATVALPVTGVAAEFTLTSPTIKDHSTIGNDHVFNGFGCTGQNVSPHLQWEHAPKDTKSFALTVYDPDAPTGSGWWHWVVVNIPAQAVELREEQAEGSNGREVHAVLHGDELGVAVDVREFLRRVEFEEVQVFVDALGLHVVLGPNLRRDFVECGAGDDDADGLFASALSAFG